MTSMDPSPRSKSRRKFLKAAGGAGALGVVGLSGCLGGGGGGGGNGQTTTPGGGGDTTEPESGMDFGGKEISVMLNVGAIDTVHKKHLIPKVEQKYNLKINTETAVTTQQLTKLQANPNNPPDVIIPDVIGIEKASREGWLEPIKDHKDVVTNLDKIYDKFIHYDSTGVSWEVGEVVPVINTNEWDSTPTSHAQVMKESKATALVPFSWSGGPYLLLMASAIATGKSFSSPNLDVDAGFEYLKKNLKPNVKTTYQGVASAKQQLASGNVDTLNLFWDYMVFDMWKGGAPIDVIFRPKPVGIAFAEAVAVPKKTKNMDAALAYVNECLSVEFQEKASQFMGCGVTNKGASVDPKAIEFGAVTSKNFDKLAFPDFQYIWENRDAWNQKWSQVFAE